MRATLRITWLLLSLSLLIHVHSTEGEDSTSGVSTGVSDTVPTIPKTDKPNEQTTKAVNKNEAATVTSVINSTDITPAMTAKRTASAKPADITTPTQSHATAATDKPGTPPIDVVQVLPTQAATNPAAITPTPAKDIPTTATVSGSGGSGGSGGSSGGNSGSSGGNSGSAGSSGGNSGSASSSDSSSNSSSNSSSSSSSNSSGNSSSSSGGGGSSGGGSSGGGSSGSTTGGSSTGSSSGGSSSTGNSSSSDSSSTGNSNSSSSGGGSGGTGSGSSGVLPHIDIVTQASQPSVPSSKTNVPMTSPGPTWTVEMTTITRAPSGPSTTMGQLVVDPTISSMTKQDRHRGATEKTTVLVTSHNQAALGSTQPTRNTQTTVLLQASTTGGRTGAGSIDNTVEAKTSQIAPTTVNIPPPQPKTFSYSLNNGQESEEQKDLVELCRRLMGNLQDGNCTLAYRHHNSKLQVDSAEINGKVKTSLVIQYFDDITKKPTDNKTLIAILASCGALLIMIVILAVCASHHRKPYNENQQHLTEELHTVENGYHDNPTLEVMEVQPEMQEKKMALNGEFNDSWIVPIDNLLKEDIPDEEDTHL